MSLTAAALSLLIAPDVMAQGCPSYEDPSPLTTVRSELLDESSGLALSRRQAGVLYTHNDSGDEPRIYAFGLDGSLLATHEVLGASATDWEDMAAGRCPGSAAPCLYIGDIGDNSESRSYVTIYAVPEPAADGPVGVLREWRVVYPDGAHNAETLLVHPLTGAITIVTKDSDGQSGVYLVPQVVGARVVEALPIAELEFDGSSSNDRLATGGDWMADGSRLVIRTYNALWEWTTDPLEPDAHWWDAPVVWDAAEEQQGEAVAYTALGEIITTSEGSPMPVSVLRCGD